MPGYYDHSYTCNEQCQPNLGKSPQTRKIGHMSRVELTLYRLRWQKPGDAVAVG